MKSVKAPTIRLICGIALVAATGLFLLSCAQGDASTKGSPHTTGTLQKMIQEKRLVVGYAGYLPFLRRDPNTGVISGYSVDLLKAITDPLGVTIEWKETTWDNMKQDLLLGKFDIMVEPIFYTIPRATQVGYTRPYAYFGFGVPVVRKGENRFRRIEDFNDPKVKLAVTQGVTDQEFVARKLPNANIKLIPGNDISITLTEVLVGKADAAIADVPTVLQFLKVHPNEVEALFLDNPPAITPAGFLVRRDDIEFLNFLNTALLTLEAGGVFDQLETSYALPSFREKRTWMRGAGLQH